MSIEVTLTSFIDDGWNQKTVKVFSVSNNFQYLKTTRQQDEDWLDSQHFLCKKNTDKQNFIQFFSSNLCYSSNLKNLHSKVSVEFRRCYILNFYDF